MASFNFGDTLVSGGTAALQGAFYGVSEAARPEDPGTSLLNPLLGAVTFAAVLTSNRASSMEQTEFPMSVAKGFYHANATVVGMRLSRLLFPQL